MSDRHAEDDDHRLYLADLNRVLDLPAAQQEEREAVDREARSSLDSAMRAERAVRDQVDAARKRLDEGARRVSTLMAKSGAVASDDDSALLPAQVAGFERETSSLLADITSAESAWSWIERARSAPAAAPAAMPTPDLVAAGAAASTTDQRAESKGGGCALLAALMFFGNLALLAVVVAMVSG